MGQGVGKILSALGIVMLLANMGCSNSKDEGTTVTDADAAKIRTSAAANIEKQIADVQSNPNIPDAQKPQIIAQIKAGAARAASGAQSGQGAKGK